MQLEVIKSLLHARANVHARDGFGGGALTGVLATANKDETHAELSRDVFFLAKLQDEGKSREQLPDRGNFFCLSITRDSHNFFGEKFLKKY